jgi:hypothetical protein
MLQLSLNVKWKVYLYLKLNGKSTWNFIKGRLGIGDGSQDLTHGTNWCVLRWHIEGCQIIIWKA